MRPEAATRRIDSFGRRFGRSPSHLYLAYHAAFPLALTPDLLYRIWANFQRDIHGKLLNIPWIAVADLLLSNLCDEVGHELYEMDNAVRNDLLRRLKEEPRFGEKRINELSDFLLAYVRKDLNSSESDKRDFAQSQRWTALAYVRPNEAAHELKLELTKAYQQDKAELFRMASLVETIADPLKEFEPLLIAVRAVKQYACGDLKSTAKHLGMKIEQNSFGEISDLNFNLQIRKQLDSIFLPHQRTKISGDKSYPTAANIPRNLRAMNRDALIVGINRYPFLSHLSTPAFDAEAIAQMLETYGGFRVRRFPEILADSSKLQVDPAAVVTAAELENAIAQLFLPNGNSIPDTALLFFAGHGLRKQLENTNLTEGYLATSDASPRKEKWGISLKWLRELLIKSPVRQQIVWLDCCHSGELFNFTEDDLLLDESKKQCFFITASREFEAAYPSLSTQHGALTEVLLKGLDPTRNSEGLINNFTLTRFLEDNLRQTPQRGMIKRGDREILLTCSDRNRLEAMLLTQKLSDSIKPISPPPTFTLTWRCVHTLKGHKDSVKSIAISPHNPIIASGSFDKTIKLWRLDTGELIDTLTGHSGTVTSVAFSPDGQSLASAAAYPDDTVKLWHPDTGRLLRNLQDPSLIVMSVWSVAFSPDGQTLVSSHNDNTIKLWHLPTGEKLRTFKGDLWPNCFRSVAFSPDGRTLIGGSFDNTIKLWQLRTNEEIRTLNGSSGWLGSVQSWMKSANDGTGIISIAISPDGQILASGSLDKTVKLWRLNDGTLRSNFTGHSDGVESVAISPDGQTIASGSRDKSIRIWNLQTEKLLCVLTEHSDTVYSVAFSHDGQTLVSGSADMTIKIWQRG